MFEIKNIIEKFEIVDKLKRLKIVVLFLRMISPGYSHCQKCGLPWKFCHEKIVRYSDYSGTFATCDYCWEHSTIEELKKYYTIVYNSQKESLRHTKYFMDHTLNDILIAVEKEYYSKLNESEYQRLIRKKKINKLKDL